MRGKYNVKLVRSNLNLLLPYKYGTSYFVGQGFNSKSTHKGNFSNAIDWNMKIRTPIYSAYSGLVIDVKENFTESGKTKNFMDKANVIKILHSDDSIAVYAHLDYNGALVEVGQRVQARQLIGYSGNTGFSSGPHLHFHISKITYSNKKLNEVTIPFKFSSCEYSTKFVPKERKFYKSC